jgi:hypothetical protein
LNVRHRLAKVYINIPAGCMPMARMEVCRTVTSL